MFFITYSQQILHWVLSICALALTVALVWFLFYLVQAAKEIKVAAEIIRSRAHKIDKWFRDFKRNFGIGMAAMTIVKEAAHSAKDFFANWQASKESETDNQGERDNIDENKFV